MPQPLDVAIRLTDGVADIAIASGDLAIDRGLTTAVLVSLFSDGRAPADADLPGAPGDVRGYWAESSADRFGSLLWLLTRALATQETLTRAKTYCEQALAWLEREGIAAGVDVAASYGPAKQLSLEIKIRRGSAEQWAQLWDETARTDFKAQGVQLAIIPA